MRGERDITHWSDGIDVFIQFIYKVSIDEIRFQFESPCFVWILFSIPIVSIESSEVTEVFLIFQQQTISYTFLFQSAENAIHIILVWHPVPVSNPRTSGSQMDGICICILFSMYYLGRKKNNVKP
jgi:hypothetical protein